MTKCNICGQKYNKQFLITYEDTQYKTEKLKQLFAVEVCQKCEKTNPALKNFTTLGIMKKCN